MEKKAWGYSMKSVTMIASLGLVIAIMAAPVTVCGGEPDTLLVQRINRLEAVMPGQPTYYYAVDTFEQGVATVWDTFTSPLTDSAQRHKTHDEFYHSALNYRANARIALIQARRFALEGNSGAAHNAIANFERNIKQLARANAGAAAVYQAGLDESEVYAEQLYRASKMAAIGLSRPMGKHVSSVVDGLFVLTDANIERTEIGLSRASKRAVSKLAVKAFFQEGGFGETGGSLGHRLDDATRAVVGQSGLYQLLGRVGFSEGVRGELMSMIATHGSAELAGLAEDKIASIVDAVLSSDQWATDDSPIEPVVPELPPYYPGRVSVSDAIRMMGPSTGYQRTQLLRKIEPSLGRNLIAVDVIALSGGRDDSHYHDNVYRLRKHLPERINTAYALAILGELDTKSRYEVLRALKPKLPVPVSLPNLHAICYGSGSHYSKNIRYLRRLWPVLSSDADAILFLSPLAGQERYLAIAGLKNMIRAPISPRILVRLAGSRADKYFVKNLHKLVPLLQPKITIAEYEFIVAGINERDKSRLDSSLISRVHTR